MDNHHLDHLVSCLAQNPILAPLGETALRELAARSSSHRLEDGTRLWKQGDASDEVAIVLVGTLDIVRRGHLGRRRVLRRIRSGDLVGLSTMGGQPHSANVVARGPAGVLLVPGDVMREVCRTRPDLALRVIAHLGALVGKLSDELEYFRCTSLAQRIVRCLWELVAGQSMVEITHRELAEHVGASRENVSRALKQLERDGAVRCHRGLIEVVDLREGGDGAR